MLKYLLALLAVPLAAADFLPLETGNTWVYRRTGGDEFFTIHVGEAAVIGGQVYHQLTSYAAERVWVRTDASGSLFYRDERTGQDALLTSFQPGATFSAPRRICPHNAVVDRETVPYQGPAGRFDSALTIRYTVLQCADVGISEEQYVADVGMVRRTTITFAGPVAFDLVQARTGGFTVGIPDGALFRISLRQAAGRVSAVLRLSVADPVKLVFPSSQEFDIAIRDQAGRQVWLWSASRTFLAVVTERVVDRERVYTAEVPVADLPDGIYTVEAWLTTIGDRREFFAVAPIEVRNRSDQEPRMRAPVRVVR
jgi:hypothetical protein